jgi:uncharacterized membrane protein
VQPAEQGNTQNDRRSYQWRSVNEMQEGPIPHKTSNMHKIWQVIEKKCKIVLDGNVTTIYTYLVHTNATDITC